MAVIIFVIISALVGIDQLIKIIVSSKIAVGESIQVIKFGDSEIFNLTHILNNGAGWSIFSGKTLFLVIITSTFIIGALVYLFKFAKKHPLLISSLILIISGGIGNLIDRIFREGFVIDYIETRFMNFPIFNFADICVVFGAIILIIYVAFFDKPQKTEALNKEMDLKNEQV